ncbi:hypothetical protein CSUB01_11934 [Colletotrichum sublineola]|uniref:Uncharacterized protein n=1 Tax=Colletotrichum sublineola TaxID=1173701 RepID=A0A066XLN6_COLSU|nr:hypothetical protein CSUB01_11934 [Colletotrichum sublineola]
MVPILPQDYAFAGSPPGTGESSLFEFGRRSLSAAPDLTAQDSLVDAAMRLVDGRDRNPVPPAEKARDRWVLVGEQRALRQPPSPDLQQHWRRRQRDGADARPRMRRTSCPR